MSTSVTNVVSHFPSAENGFTTTLASTISSGATTVPLTSVSGYSNGEVAVFVVDPSDASKKQTFTGVVDTSGVQITNVVWTAGTNQTHSGGATVVDYATATHISMITKGLLVEHTQAGRHALSSSSSLTSTKVITALNDTNGNELLKVTATGSAVNELTLANAATGNNPSLTASGDDTNIGLNLVPKGTGVFQVGGNTFSHGAWTSTTPTFTNLTVGNGTHASRYVVYGKTVVMKVSFILGSTSSVGTGAYFTLPVATNSSIAQNGYLGSGLILDSGTGTIPCSFRRGTTTSIAEIVFDDVSGTYPAHVMTTSTTPMTWATSDAITGILIYDVA